MKAMGDRSVSRTGWCVGRPGLLALAMVFLATGAFARQRETRETVQTAGTKTPRLAAPAIAAATLQRDGDGGDGIEVISGPIDFGELTLASERRLDRAVVVRVISTTDWVLRIVPDSESSHESRAAKLFWRSQWSRKFSPLTSFAAVAHGRATGPAGTLVMLDLKFAVGDAESTGQYQTRFGFELASR